jgi:integrase
MSVRKRQWYTNKQIQAYAKRLAKKAGEIEDRRPEHQAHARDELMELLRKARENDPAAVKAVKAFPPEEAWMVDYAVNGGRHIETFKRKKDADARAAQVTVDVGKGIHIAPNKTPTVKEAGDLWIQACKTDELERATIAAYEQHLRLHIVPHLGTLRLGQLTVPVIRQFRDDLLAGKLSPAELAAVKNGEIHSKDKKRTAVMAKRVLVSLGTMLADAQERGLVATNVVRGMKRDRKRGKDRQAEGRKRGKLKVGIDLPTTEEINAIIAKLSDRWRPVIVTAMFTGLRASELRGLRWKDVDLKKAKLDVRQRADRYLEIGDPKSEAGERTIPLPAPVVNMLREWKLKCPKGELVFPSGAGNVEHHANILHRGFEPAQLAASVTAPVLDDKGKPIRDEDGKPVVAPKYALHALRHYYASWCINREKDGGLGLPMKMVQERLGHSTITLTADVYGHLFPTDDDGAEMDKAMKFFPTLSAT